MNREAAEVHKSIWELLGPGAPLSAHTHTNMTDDNFPDQVSEDMYYSQDSSCTERSKSDADDIIDETQNLIFNGKNDTPISDTPIVIPSTFPLSMWNNQLMVHYGLPRTTNSVEAWHRSFATHI